MEQSPKKPPILRYRSERWQVACAVLTFFMLILLQMALTRGRHPEPKWTLIEYPTATARDIFRLPRIQSSSELKECMDSKHHLMIERAKSNPPGPQNPVENGRFECGKNCRLDKETTQLNCDSFVDVGASL